MILGIIFSWKGEIGKKRCKNPFGGPALGFPHWLNYKDVFLAWAALIYGHLKWSLMSLFCSYFLFSCQPFQQSLLFWNWFSGAWKEVWFIWIQSSSDLLFCVCNKHRKSRSSSLQCIITFSPSSGSLTFCVTLFLFVNHTDTAVPYWKICTLLESLSKCT